VLSKHILIELVQKILWKVFEFHPRQIVVDTSNVDEIAVDEEGEKMKWKYREIKK
jgi:hypothetical protein